MITRREVLFGLAGAGTLAITAGVAALFSSGKKNGKCCLCGYEMNISNKYKDNNSQWIKKIQCPRCSEFTQVSCWYDAAEPEEKEEKRPPDTHNWNGNKKPAKPSWEN